MLARFFIDRPVLAWVISVVIVLLGGIAAALLPVAEYPEIHSPVHQSVIQHKQRGIATLRELLSDFDLAEPEPVAQQISLLIEGAIVSAHTFGNTTALAHARNAALALVKAAP